MTAVLPICDALGRLVGVVETLARRVDVLELERLYRQGETRPADSPEWDELGQ